MEPSITINELNHYQIQQLATKMDRTGKNGTKLWILIANQLITDSWCLGIIDTLEDTSTDSEKWIKHLTCNHSEIGVLRLIEIAEEVGRYDVAVFLQNILCSKDLERIGDLSPYEQRKFGRILHARSDSEHVNGWRAFTKKLYCIDDDFLLPCHKQMILSPSGRLIVFLQKMYPETDVSNIREIAIRNKRFDVVKILNDIITSVISDKRSTGIWIDEVEIRDYSLSQH